MELSKVVKCMYNGMDRNPSDSDLESESGMKLWNPELDIRRLLD